MSQKDDENIVGVLGGETKRTPTFLKYCIMYKHKIQSDESHFAQPVKWSGDHDLIGVFLLMLLLLLFEGNFSQRR